jgi:hypothetical protein
MKTMAVHPGLSLGGFRCCCTVVPDLLRFTFRCCDCATRVQVGPRYRDKGILVTNSSKTNRRHVTWICCAGAWRVTTNQLTGMEWGSWTGLERESSSACSLAGNY